MIEKNVCSLEYAKKLKELNVKYESLFCYLPMFDGSNHLLFYRELSHDKNNYYMTFLASELLEILPHRITLPEGEPYNSFILRVEKGIWVNDKSNNLNNVQFSEFYKINYICDTTSEERSWMSGMSYSLTKNITDEKLADSLAMMLIYVIENGWIKINENI